MLCFCAAGGDPPLGFEVAFAAGAGVFCFCVEGGDAFGFDAAFGDGVLFCVEGGDEFGLDVAFPDDGAGVLFGCAGGLFPDAATTSFAVGCADAGTDRG